MSHGRKPAVQLTRAADVARCVETHGNAVAYCQRLPSDERPVACQRITMGRAGRPLSASQESSNHSAEFPKASSFLTQSFTQPIGIFPSAPNVRTLFIKI